MDSNIQNQNYYRKRGYYNNAFGITSKRGGSSSGLSKRRRKKLTKVKEESVKLRLSEHKLQLTAVG